MFRALITHPQEALHKLQFVYCVRIMSIGFATIAVSLESWHSQLAKVHHAGFIILIHKRVCVRNET
jgi:hypothetical protein